MKRSKSHGYPLYRSDSCTSVTSIPALGNEYDRIFGFPKDLFPVSFWPEGYKLALTAYENGWAIMPLYGSVSTY